MSSHAEVPVGYGNLILTRKQGESIIVGNGLVKVKVIKVRGSRVRISISCPREMSVAREEIKVKS